MYAILNLSKSDNLNLRSKSGNNGFVGENGVGKTTLIKA